MTTGEEPAFAASVTARAHVFVPALTDELVVDGPDGHHLARVRRLRGGERVTAADGTGAWREYVVASAVEGRLTASADGAPRTEPTLDPGLAVVFAATKGGKPERVVAQLTELGVDRVMVFMGERSVARLVGDAGEREVERLRRVAREAAMQCHRARVPDISLAAFTDLVTHPGALVADRDGADPSTVGSPVGGEWLVLVGPEGGFGVEETTALAGLPRVAVGPNVLRADTASPAVAAVLAARRTPRNPGNSDT